MLKAFITTSIAMMIFFGCALEEKTSENSPAPTEETTWIPEQK